MSNRGMVDVGTSQKSPKSYSNAGSSLPYNHLHKPHPPIPQFASSSYKKQADKNNFIRRKFVED
jgi:hypothetical protein